MMIIKEITFADIKEIANDYLDYFNNYEGDHWNNEAAT